jgi:hypothetical protein
MGTKGFLDFTTFSSETARRYARFSSAVIHFWAFSIHRVPFAQGFRFFMVTEEDIIIYDNNN